jgi:ferredoxin
MDIEVDLDLCQGYGNCVTAAPDFFDVDDAGKVVLLRATTETAEERRAVMDAAPMCPMSAIRAVESGSPAETEAR